MGVLFVFGFVMAVLVGFLLVFIFWVVFLFVCF